MSENLEQNQKIGILGAGAWGNTLAFLLGQKAGREIILWDYDPRRVRKLKATRRFKKPLVQKYLDSITISNNLRDLSTCPIILNTIPLKGIAEVFSALKEIRAISEDVIIVSGSKGIEPTTLKTPSEIIRQYFPKNQIVVFAGPNLATEMIRGKPMLAVAASSDIKIAELIQQEFSGPTLRVYSSTDIRGVELCAALKNVMAIAAGCIDSLELGESAKASLITRGLHEMGKFIALYDTDPCTLLSPAGVGDLIATCSSNLSRNHRVGFLLAKGKKLRDIVASIGEVVEGVNTTHAVYRICQERGLELPIIAQVKKILDGDVTPVEAVLNLMSRPVV